MLSKVNLEPVLVKAQEVELVGGGPALQWRWWYESALGPTDHPTEGHPVQPTMNQHGAVVPSSRLDARAVQGCLFIIPLLQQDAKHLAARHSRQPMATV